MTQNRVVVEKPATVRRSILSLWNKQSRHFHRGLQTYICMCDNRRRSSRGPVWSSAGSRGGVTCQKSEVDCGKLAAARLFAKSGARYQGM